MIDPSDLLLQISNSTSAAGLTSNNGVIEQAVDRTQDTVYGGLAAAGTAISGIAAKIFHDNRKNKETERESDFDQEEYRRLRNIEDKYTLSNPTKTRAEILNMPAYPDEPAIKTSLAEAYAQDYKDWKIHNTKKYYQKK